jgi:hypothetical protein
MKPAQEMDSDIMSYLLPRWEPPGPRAKNQLTLIFRVWDEYKSRKFRIDHKQAAELVRIFESILELRFAIRRD